MIYFVDGQMKIIKADQSHADIVLTLLDQFKTQCKRLSSPGSDFVSTTAREQWASIFRELVDSDKFVIYLALDGEKYIWIVTACLIPQMRNASCIVEIEDMFVLPQYQWSWAATQLMDAVVSWAKLKWAIAIRLESANELERAHGFYRKYWFVSYWTAFKFLLDT